MNDAFIYELDNFLSLFYSKIIFQLLIYETINPIANFIQKSKIEN